MVASETIAFEGEAGPFPFLTLECEVSLAMLCSKEFPSKSATQSTSPESVRTMWEKLTFLIKAYRTRPTPTYF